VKGLIFDRKASSSAGGPTRVEKAKIGLIQFQISPPKTDIEQRRQCRTTHRQVHASTCYRASSVCDSVCLLHTLFSPSKGDYQSALLVVCVSCRWTSIREEERNYILNIIKKIKATGCNVLLVQKSILRDAVTPTSRCTTWPRPRSWWCATWSATTWTSSRAPSPAPHCEPRALQAREAGDRRPGRGRASRGEQGEPAGL